MRNNNNLIIIITYEEINNNLWGKLVSLSPIILDDNLKITSVSFFIADFFSFIFYY